MGVERKEEGEIVGSREMVYEGMHPMPPSEIGRAKRRVFERDLRMKSLL